MYILPGFGATVDPAQYGTTTLPILLDDVKCSGDESNLLSCPQLPINSTHNCQHFEDVAIQCTGKVHEEKLFPSYQTISENLSLSAVKFH